MCCQEFQNGHANHALGILELDVDIFALKWDEIQVFATSTTPCEVGCGTDRLTKINQTL